MLRVDRVRIFSSTFPQHAVWLSTQSRHVPKASDSFESFDPSILRPTGLRPFSVDFL